MALDNASGAWPMHIQVAAGEFEEEFRQLVPGARVKYRGGLWKIVGMYLASAPHCHEDGRAAASGTVGTKYLILQSLDLPLENLLVPGAVRP